VRSTPGPDFLVLKLSLQKGANVETKLFAFVLMPFDPSFEDVYRFGIKEPAAEIGILAERVDEQIYREGILDRIYRQIELADIIIADMTGKNPNVFYEVGYAHAKDKLCILLTSDADDIPFDLKHRRHVVYGGSIKLLREQLISELQWAQGEIQNIRRSRIKVTLQNPFGKLEKTKYWAEGEIDFRADLLNESDKTSSELEALYFYSTKEWTVFQDNRECLSTESDLPDFAKRHFLTPLLRRLHKGAWAQVKFISKKTLAWAIRGEELKDSYRVSGRSVLRLVTSEGNFDYTLSIDVTVDDIPF
jgi:nucleoside 2-deoxyribosyltransferase